MEVQMLKSGSIGRDVGRSPDGSLHLRRKMMQLLLKLQSWSGRMMMHLRHRRSRVNLLQALHLQTFKMLHLESLGLLLKSG